jgi:hypothetical protein
MSTAATNQILADPRFADFTCVEVVDDMVNVSCKELMAILQEVVTEYTSSTHPDPNGGFAGATVCCSDQVLVTKTRFVVGIRNLPDLPPDEEREELALRLAALQEEHNLLLETIRSHQAEQ